MAKEVAFLEYYNKRLQIKLSTFLCLYIQNRLSLTESMLYTYVLIELHVRMRSPTHTYV